MNPVTNDTDPAPFEAPGQPLPQPRGVGRRLRRRLERGLLALGCAALGVCAMAYVETGLFQTVQGRRLESIVRGHGTRGPLNPIEGDEGGSRRATRARAEARSSGLIGRIEIPRIHLSAIIEEGIDTPTLLLAVGHVPGTSLPGEGGNVALAGHRDTFFQRLWRVRTSDPIRIVTPDGAFAYRVEATEVVSPARGELLDRTEHPTLTLITCYPFHFIGSAPLRFVIRARQVSPGREPSA